MQIETITDQIHEYMYDRLNESNNSDDGKNVKHINEKNRKRKSQNPPTRKDKLSGQLEAKTKKTQNSC